MFLMLTKFTQGGTIRQAKKLKDSRAIHKGVQTQDRVSPSQAGGSEKKMFWRAPSPPQAEWFLLYFCFSRSVWFTPFNPKLSNLTFENLISLKYSFIHYPHFKDSSLFPPPLTSVLSISRKIHNNSLFGAEFSS